MMKKWISMLSAVTLIAVISVGCGGGDASKPIKKDDGGKKSSSVNTPEVNKVSAKVCLACGETDETKCCAKDAEKCTKCSLTKGSPACCKIEKGEGFACLKCGEKTGTEKCCDKDAEKCGKCEKNKGSVLCCKDVKAT